jgi:cell division protein FtsB
LGRKRTGTRKYLYLSIAGMIFISFAGCATIKKMEAEREAREYLITAQKLLDQGDYEGSLKENQKILSLYDTVPPGDEALFNIGLIYADYGYPQKDHKKSLDSFKRLVEVFPLSPLVQQAKIWMGILQENRRLNGKIEELNKTIKKSKMENERLNREIEELNKTIKKSKMENERLNREIEELNKTIKKSKMENERLNREIEKLNKTIKKSKEVDIELDEKKKELSK